MWVHVRVQLVDNGLRVPQDQVSLPTCSSGRGHAQRARVCAGPFVEVQQVLLPALSPSTDGRMKKKGRRLLYLLPTKMIGFLFIYL